MGERRVTVVTGAGQGIGREITLAFAAKGDAVVLASRNVPNLEAAAGAVAEVGGEPMVVETDVTDAAAVNAMARTVLGRDGRIDVHVANSGVGGPSGVLWELDPAERDAIFRVNVAGVFLSARAVLPAMIATAPAASW